MKSLREQMGDAMILRGFAALAKHYCRSPDLLTPEEIRAYLLHQIAERKLSWSTC